MYVQCETTSTLAWESWAGRRSKAQGLGKLLITYQENNSCHIKKNKRLEFEMRMVYTPVYCISWHNTIIEQSAAPLPSVSRICRVRLFNVVQIAATPEAWDRGPRSDVQGARAWETTYYT